MSPRSHREIDTLETLEEHFASESGLTGHVLQNLDLRSFTEKLLAAELTGAVFLGCRIDSAAIPRLVESGALVFPELPAVPYEPYRSRLYSPDELLGGYEPGNHDTYRTTLDGRIFEHFVATGRDQPHDLLEALARRLHDLAISDALAEVIEGEKVVAIMGGHSLARTDPAYSTVVEIGRALTRKGFLVATGGGPGAMEAAHLGASLSAHDDSGLGSALELATQAPLYDPIGPWLDAAFEVEALLAEEKMPAAKSVGLPTWLYGHEPPTLFASHIAKYFANSLRETGLVTIARHGIVFAPGSAGTVQEIFQDATQNHYETQGFPSPMVLLGHDYWTRVLPVVPLLAELSADRRYRHLIHTCRDAAEAVELIASFEPEADVG